MVEVRYTRELAEAAEGLEAGLSADPVANNVALSIIDWLRRKGGDGHFWWIGDGGSPSAFALQGQAGRPLLVSTNERAKTGVLVDAVAEVIRDDDEVVGMVSGEIRSAAAFAGGWAQNRGVGAKVALIQRLYSLDTARLQRPANPPPGDLRLATVDDVDVLLPWALGFQRDVFGRGVTDVAGLDEEMVAKVEQDEVWIWEADRPMAMTCNTRPVGATSRIQQVYTPLENRGRGFAAACVAGVVDRLVIDRDVERCVLLTDLANPTSNAVYQRLGFEAIEEQANIEFENRSPNR